MPAVSPQVDLGEARPQDPKSTLYLQPRLGLAEQPTFLSPRCHLPLREVPFPGPSSWSLSLMCCSCRQTWWRDVQVGMGQDPPSGLISRQSPKPLRPRATAFGTWGLQPLLLCALGLGDFWSSGRAHLLAIAGPFSQCHVRVHLSGCHHLTRTSGWLR